MSINPWIRRRFLLRAFAAATICLFAGVLLVIASRSISGWSLLGAIVLLVSMIVFASRTVASWWQYARFCPECGEILGGSWCDLCQQYSTADLLVAPLGIFDTRLYNNHHDDFARLISLVLSIALRDQASALRIRRGVDETQIWTLDATEGWVEWLPPPDSVFLPVASAVMTIAGLPIEKASDAEGEFLVVDPGGVEHACRVKFSPADEQPQLIMQLEGSCEQLQPCGDS